MIRSFISRTCNVRHALPVGFLVLAALVVVGCAGGARPQTAGTGDQIAFGVQMAQRGLWNEALFRFQQAERLEPNNPRLLNNLAVAYEAVGRFDQALETYQRAARSAPQDAEIRRNYSRFSQFYESFRPREEDGEPEAESEAEEGAEVREEPAAEEAPSETSEAPDEAPEHQPQADPEDA